MNRGVINEHAALGHHFFDVTQAQRVRCVPAHADQHHLQRIVHPLDYLAQRLDHQHHPVVRLGSAYQHRLTATEPPACVLGSSLLMRMSSSMRWRSGGTPCVDGIMVVLLR
jgi:hypothetical protein